jgi:putative tricarboxylic transport membrane protein
MVDASLVPSVSYDNKGGAAGALGLAQFVNASKGDPQALMLLVLNLPLVGLWVKLLQIPRAPLYAGILIFATVGVYGMRQSAFDLYLMLGSGLLGLALRRLDFPTAPVIVGMILGPMAEAQMRNALSIGEGRWGVFLERPVSAVLLGVVLAVLVLPPVWRLLARRARAA